MIKLGVKNTSKNHWIEKKFLIIKTQQLPCDDNECMKTKQLPFDDNEIMKRKQLPFDDN